MKMTMRALIAALLGMVGVAQAQEGDVGAGEKLYISQCKICHGSVSPEASLGLPRLALAAVERTASDAAAVPVYVGAAGQHVAFAPPFGPHLRGVYGRKAGTVEGFQYSSAFLSALKDMEWNEAALDVWITGPQLWVPGVYMFYKQSDPEV